MRAYGIFPTIGSLELDEALVQKCITLVTEIVCDRLRADGDVFHFAVDWRDPAGEPWAGWILHGSQAHCIALSDPAELAELVRLAVDPNSGKGVPVIRSAATCRAATFGFDGQAFLCLRNEDEAPISPDPALVVIEEHPEYLTETDYFDGVVVSALNGD